MMTSVKNDISAGLCLILLAFLLCLVHLNSRDQELAGRISEKVLRFHVIADSNQTEDQSLKLEVRSLLLNEIANGLAESQGCETASKEQAASYVNLHKAQLEQAANEFIRSRGFSYETQIQVGVSHFPTKIYGDMLFPAGDYDAVRVILGKGKGRNWWCVLYPSLCFVSDTAAVVPDSSKKELAGLLAEEDYESLFAVHPDIQLSFRLPEWWDSFSSNFAPQTPRP